MSKTDKYLYVLIYAGTIVGLSLLAFKATGVVH